MEAYPVWDGWFSLTGRRNRLNYFLAVVLLALVLLTVFAIIYFFALTGNGAKAALLFFVLPGVWAHYALTSQRLRDIGTTGWLCLLWIPAGLADSALHGAASLALWLVLLAVPGTRGVNRYGDDPLQT